MNLPEKLFQWILDSADVVMPSADLTYRGRPVTLTVVGYHEDLFRVIDDDTFGFCLKLNFTDKETAEITNTMEFLRIRVNPTDNPITFEVYKPDPDIVFGRFELAEEHYNEYLKLKLENL